MCLDEPKAPILTFRHRGKGLKQGEGVGLGGRLAYLLPPGGGPMSSGSSRLATESEIEVGARFQPTAPSRFTLKS